MLKAGSEGKGALLLQRQKNSLKTQEMHFLPVFELMSDSLMTIYVELHQCPTHQSILYIYNIPLDLSATNRKNWPNDVEAIFGITQIAKLGFLKIWNLDGIKSVTVIPCSGL